MSEGKSDYKDTLNLPQTSFDMKANLVAKEPAIQARWAARKLYQQIRAARKGAPRFILHDGPPYANGPVHMGTALNKVLKDIVVRVKNMTGFDAPFVPGYDCHGLPIEQKVTDELGAKADGLPVTDLRKRCAAVAGKFIPLQSEQFRRLAVMGDFENRYATMDPAYEAAVLEVFARLVEQDLVYKQLRPVHWSIENRTALAEAELEYQDRTDPSITVALAVSDACAAAVPHEKGEEVYLLVWTTTPWTLPANLAVAVHPEYAYAAVHADTADGPVTVVLAEERLEAVVGAIHAARPGWLKSHKVVGKLTGAELIAAKLTYRHPILDGKTCPVVPAEYVTLEDGTGLVHTAPGHGLEDYGTGLKCGLDIYCPVREDGMFDDSVPAWLTGKGVWQANAEIVAHLRQHGTLVAEQTVTHSYPHDWRSKTPTIFRATEQWFVAVDRPMAKGSGAKKSLREGAMEICRREAGKGGVEFIPAWGRNRMAGMLESRPDWCISRQRAWGLPIPAFYNRAGQPLLTPSSIRAVAAVIAKEGSDAWYKHSPAELLAGYKPSADRRLREPAAFAIEELTAGRDTFDVWFESGSSWFAAAGAKNLASGSPADMYLEGSDQHRGWFQVSLLLALGAAGKVPYRALVTHGYIVDEQGRTKMSKSLGNVMNVADQMNKRGADILRLWLAWQNYPEDIRCGEGLIAQADDAYRKIRNTLRYCMGACHDFDPGHHLVQPTAHSVDLWMKMQTHLLIRDVREAYDRYEFHKATRRIHEFCTVQASSIYMSAVKDRLYCESSHSPRRMATQTVLHEMLVALVKLLAPILPHTAEEAWEHIPFRPPQEPDSVHLACLPEVDAEMLRMAEELRPEAVDLTSFAGDVLQAGPAWVWDRLLDLRGAGLVKLEALRNAGVKNPLDAEVVFHVAAGKDAVERMIQTYLKEMEDLLGAGYARMEGGASLPAGEVVDVEVLDARDRYKRCARSWKRRPDVGSDPQYPDLSARDAAVMRQLAQSG
ncbi:MAG: isoleucine--tRNA ligase [Phycisphaerae bacterium]